MKKRADLLLVEKKIVESRSKAQAVIMAGQIFIDGKKVLKGIDLNLKPNMSNIILGKSGWGKSVLIKLIYKLILK